jgi:hypothetical protein
MSKSTQDVRRTKQEELSLIQSLTIDIDESAATNNAESINRGRVSKADKPVANFSRSAREDFNSGRKLEGGCEREQHEAQQLHRMVHNCDDAIGCLHTEETFQGEGSSLDCSRIVHRYVPHKHSFLDVQ